MTDYISDIDYQKLYHCYLQLGNESPEVYHTYYDKIPVFDCAYCNMECNKLVCCSLCEFSHKCTCCNKYTYSETYEIQSDDILIDYEIDDIDSVRFCESCRTKNILQVSFCD